MPRIPEHPKQPAYLSQVEHLKMPKTTANNANRPAVLEVSLGDTVVGTLTNLPNDQNLFGFDPTYIADDNRPILGSVLILSAVSCAVSSTSLVGTAHSSGDCSALRFYPK